jgi:hypothetical protein
MRAEGTGYIPRVVVSSMISLAASSAVNRIKYGKIQAAFCTTTPSIGHRFSSNYYKVFEPNIPPPKA